MVQICCVSRWRDTRHKRLCRPAPRSWLQHATRLKSAALRTVHRPAAGWPMHCRREAHAAAAQPGRRSAKSRERHPKRCHRGAETPLNDAENGVHVCTSWALRRRRRETLDGFLPWGGPQSDPWICRYKLRSSFGAGNCVESTAGHLLERLRPDTVEGL